MSVCQRTEPTHARRLVRGALVAALLTMTGATGGCSASPNEASGWTAFGRYTTTTPEAAGGYSSISFDSKGRFLGSRGDALVVGSFALLDGNLELTPDLPNGNERVSIRVARGVARRAAPAKLAGRSITPRADHDAAAGMPAACMLVASDSNFSELDSPMAEPTPSTPPAVTLLPDDCDAQLLVSQGLPIAMIMDTTSNDNGDVSGTLERVSGGAEQLPSAMKIASAATGDPDSGVLPVVWGLFVFGLQVTGDTLSVTFQGIAGSSSANQAAPARKNQSTPFDILISTIMSTPALRDPIRDALRSRDAATAISVLKSELDALRKRLSKNHEAERGEELAKATSGAPRRTSEAPRTGTSA